MPVASPCIAVCSLDDATGYCKGCWRTVQEIGRWPYCSDREKQMILQAIAERKLRGAA